MHLQKNPAKIRSQSNKKVILQWTFWMLSPAEVLKNCDLNKGYKANKHTFYFNEYFIVYFSYIEKST